MIIPIVGGVAALGTGAAVCLRGVVTQSGSGPGGEWRLRWACWRWIAEFRSRSAAGVFGDWARMGVYSMGEREKAKMSAMAMALMPQSALAGIAATVKIRRASLSDQ